MVKLQKKEQERLEKLQREQKQKDKKQKDLSMNQFECPQSQSTANVEDQLLEEEDHNKGTEKVAADYQESEADKPTSELSPTESVIKRSKPKNTKPAPAVVAIPMAELLGVSN